jgi:hypothetical protein
LEFSLRSSKARGRILNLKKPLLARPSVLSLILTIYNLPTRLTHFNDHQKKSFFHRRWYLTQPGIGCVLGQREREMKICKRFDVFFLFFCGWCRCGEQKLSGSRENKSKMHEARLMK